MKIRIIFCLSMILLLSCSCGNNNNKSQSSQTHDSLSANKSGNANTSAIISQKIITPKEYQISIVKKYTHPGRGFTQGLLFNDGYLYEGTGLIGASYIRKIDLEKGKIIQEKRLDGNYFGEGITILKNKIFELTWTNGVCFVWDLESFNNVNSFSYTGEGWGLTNDGQYLIMSDGTDILRFISPDDFHVIKTINVTEQGNPIDKINELEYIDGKIWANIWETDKIIIIDPASGQVTGTIDAQILKKSLKPGGNDDVLNGIAYNPKDKKIYFTGKLWPFIFEVKVEEK